MSTIRARINHQIRAVTLRVIGPAGENFGVMPLQEALKKAEEFGSDLIEISPEAVPPVAKVVDYGKYQYEESKKQKGARAKSHASEVKSVQVKIGTGEHDLALKAKKVGEWLAENHRVKIELFLSGRAKFLDEKFLRERLDRMLKIVPTAYKVADPVRRGPKGLTIIVEKQ